MGRFGRKLKKKNNVVQQLAQVIEEEFAPFRQTQGERIWQRILDGDVSECPSFKKVLSSFDDMGEFFEAWSAVSEVNDEMFSELLYKSATDEETLSRLEAVFAGVAEKATKATEEYNKISDEEKADEYSDKTTTILECSLIDSLEDLCRKEVAQ